jgi:(2Fe-2S) ferredoxin
MKFKKHVFICTHQRQDGSRKCCGETEGMDLVRAFKKGLKERGLNDQIRAQRAGCLDACETGPSLVVYPEGIYYSGVKSEHVDQIIENHLISDNPVLSLVLKEDESHSDE